MTVDQILGLENSETDQDLSIQGRITPEILQRCTIKSYVFPWPYDVLKITYSEMFLLLT